jgi:hypothetical protein
MEISNRIFRRADKVNPNQKVLIDGDIYTRDLAYYSYFTQRFIDIKHPRCIRLISSRSLVLEIIPTIKYATKKISCIKL